MDRTDLVRLRWRLSGAWLWPCFLVLTVVDAAVIHWLPPEGDSESAIGAWLLAGALMLLAVVLFSPLLGALLRKGRSDMPKSVARNYAGTFAALGVSLAFLAGGIAHRHVIMTDRAALLDARNRAELWIGDHAPTQFQSNMRVTDAFEVQPPELYRICVPNFGETRYFCVVVDRSKPFGAGVTPDGTESNEMLEQGAS
jgi:hypothetical protein